MTRGRERGRNRITRWSSPTGSSSKVAEVTVVLPMDIIEHEILWRLPVKSLLRCKSVCKLWYSLIKNPNPKFIKTHYHHKNNTTRPLLLQMYQYIHIYPYAYNMPVAFNPSVKKHYSFWPIPVNLYRNWNLGGKNDNNINALSFFSYYLGIPSLGMFVRPVNGVSLIVLPDYDMYRCRMAMLNPATRQFRKLPIDDFEVNTLPEHKLYPFNVHHIFGFGICSSSKYTGTTLHDLVYKVVWLNQLPSQIDVVVAKVYTVVIGGGGGGDQDWRVINAALPGDYVSYYCNDPSFNVSMNGKCYWLSRDLARILVFDMDEEVFREMDSPVPSKYLEDYVIPGKRYNVVFSEVRCHDEERDSLALFVFRPDFVDISVLDKEEGWHWIRYKVFYIDMPVRDLFNLNPLRLQELLLAPITEAILLKAGLNSFALYNPKSNICVRFNDPLYSGDAYVDISVFNFKESLYSIDGAIQVSDRVLEDFCTFQFAS